MTLFDFNLQQVRNYVILQYQTVWNSPEIMQFFSTKQSGKVWSSLQKCYFNLQTVLELNATFHFLVQIYTIF